MPRIIVDTVSLISMSEIEYIQGLCHQVQTAYNLLKTNENISLADETIESLICPVMSLQFPSPESDDARQLARKAYRGLSDYIEHRYPERKLAIIRPDSLFHTVLALHFSAMLSRSPIWDGILAVREFTHSHTTDLETFDSLMRQANAALLAAESDVELYLALKFVKALNSLSVAPDLLRRKELKDLAPLKRKVHSRLHHRLYKQDRRKWHDDFRQRLFEIQGKVCAGCGAKFNSHSTMALDHIESPITGGADTPGNLQLLCLSCNGTKNAWGMRHLRKRLMEEKRMVDLEAAEEAHKAALSFIG